MSRGLRPILSAILLLVALACARPAYATGRAECLSLHSRILGRSVAYCVLLPPSYASETTRRYPVLYFLHGLGQNEQMFIGSGGFDLVEDLWEQGKLGEYLIVTPDGDRSFYINSRDSRQRYEDFFLQEFLPFIERRYRTRAGRDYRGIAGVSMGGYGSLRLAFAHPELFGSVSAHSAALVENPPKLRAEGSAQTLLGQILGGVFGSPPDRAFWDRNSPFTLARSAHLAGLKIYFDCGTEDSYGFYTGAEALHNLLAAHNIPHEFHLYSGAHDWRYFAEHLPASLEFHSRVFGLSPSQK